MTREDTSCKLGMGGVRGWLVAGPRGMPRSHGHLATLMREEWPLTLALYERERERERKREKKLDVAAQLGEAIYAPSNVDACRRSSCLGGLAEWARSMQDVTWRHQGHHSQHEYAPCSYVYHPPEWQSFHIGITCTASMPCLENTTMVSACCTMTAGVARPTGRSHRRAPTCDDYRAVEAWLDDMRRGIWT